MEEKDEGHHYADGQQGFKEKAGINAQVGEDLIYGLHWERR